MNSSPYSQDTFKSSSVLGGTTVRFNPPSLLPEDLTSFGHAILEEESLYNNSSKEKNQLPPVVNLNVPRKSTRTLNEGICSWRTTGELICPIQKRTSGNNFNVLLFQQITHSQQRDLVSKLFQLWSTSYRAMGITSMQMLELFIRETFVQGNALFVAVSSNGSVLGCTAIDFLRSIPFISSQMSVYNDKELLSTLEDRAVSYGSQFHYPAVQVWCNKENIAFYKERGWKFLMETQTKSGWKIVMEKKYY